MSLFAIILWLLNISVDTLGQLTFKFAAVDADKKVSSEHNNNNNNNSNNKADNFAYWKQLLLRPYIWLGVLFYIAEFVVWLCFLSQVELSVGVMLGSINIVILMLLGRIFFAEALSFWRVLGILLISIGVAVVGFGSSL